MHTVVRIYKSAELADKLLDHKSEVERVMGEVPGFVSYALIRAGGSTVAVATCRDERGCEDSVRRAREWLRDNATDIAVPEPEILSGENVIQFSAAR